jgi:uncharacterized protein (TIGR03118 family)
MKMQTSMRVCVAGIAMVSALLLFAMSSGTAPGTPVVTILSPSKQSPVQTNLVSDIPGLATVTTDPNLINPWGISNSPTSPYWVADQGTNKTTLYNGQGTPNAVVVNVPAVGIPSGPTGTVFNSTTGFLVSGTAANFIFVTLDGTVAAGTGTAARITEATLPGAVFTGLALANNGTANFLYAADFVSGQTIKVFDSTFALTTLTAAFVDPTLPVGYAPYNIQLLSGKLYVTYAQIGVRGANIGPGLGYVSVFDTNGNFLQRLISNGPLNAPWGLAIAPTGFMNFAGDLLVGNFGDGIINAFDPATGTFLGTISNPAGHPIANPGLWAIQFGNGNLGSTATTLFFNAGINNEQDGLFGSITPGPVTLNFAPQLVNTPSAQTLTVENTGSAALTLSAAPALTGTNTADFAVAAGSTCTNGATVAAGSSCTITVTFTPGAVGSRGPATLSIADNAAGSPQTVIVTGTGAAPAPAVTLAPLTPLTFPGQLVSTASTAQTITVTNSGTASLTFGASAISVSNDFAQTNTCNGATVALSATCAINVTFNPAATTNNPRTGTLSIADNAAGSPQTVALSGTAWDFNLSAPTSAATSAGTPASIVVTVNALGGFTGPVTLTCLGTIPQGNCAAPSGAVTAPGSGTLTVTTAASFLPPPPASWHMPPLSTRQIVLISFALLLLLALLAAGRTRTRLSFAGAMLICVILAGCANSTPTTNNRTPAGSYPLTVTGTSGGVSHTVTVTLTVN